MDQETASQEKIKKSLRDIDGFMGVVIDEEILSPSPWWRIAFSPTVDAAKGST
ncbi:MAG: hypothetical protein AAF543_15695 [Pseudomonadota bacterium]